jgi:GNAT superfamily N-acetyltransferase
MDINIRPARPEDAAVLTDFQILMARETEGLELDRSTVERGVAAVFADPGKGEYWLAEEAGRVLACLLVTFEWSDWRNGTVLWVQSVYVLPEARGRGIYRRLYEHLKARVESAPDLRGIRLYMDKRNAAARRVYERLGMTREHYELFEWIKDVSC